MEVWHIWAVVSILCVVIEVFTTGFAVLCLSVGAVAGAVVAAVGLDLEWQLSAFAVFTALSFVFVRPLLVRKVYRRDGVRKSGIDALPGREAIVTEAIDGQNHGRVSVDGDSWRAVASSADVIAAGTKVRILEVRSNILVVDEAC